jgi:hypothetical protein
MSTPADLHGPEYMNHGLYSDISHAIHGMDMCASKILQERPNLLWRMLPKGLYWFVTAILASSARSKNC